MNVDSWIASVSEFASQMEPWEWVVAAAIANNGRSLQYTAAELKADHGFVLAAVTQNGKALQYATPELKLNHDINH